MVLHFPHSTQRAAPVALRRSLRLPIVASSVGTGLDTRLPLIEVSGHQIQNRSLQTIGCSIGGPVRLQASRIPAEVLDNRPGPIGLFGRQPSTRVETAAFRAASRYEHTLGTQSLQIQKHAGVYLTNASKPNDFDMGAVLYQRVFEGSGAALTRQNHKWIRNPKCVIETGSPPH